MDPSIVDAAPIGARPGFLPASMIEQWILDKIRPLKPASLIILRDPQRMIQAIAYVMDGWAEKNG